MPITLCWQVAGSADDTHDDISTDISGVLVGFVTEDADPDDPELRWSWCIEDWTYDENDEIPAEPAVLARGFVATKQAGRTAVMDWVRGLRATADSATVLSSAMEEAR